MRTPEEGSALGQLGELYEAIETVYAARSRSKILGDHDGVGGSEQALRQLLGELHARLGYTPTDGSTDPSGPQPPETG